MIHITEEQVREALSMEKAIELVEGCFRRLDTGRAVNHPRRRVVLENRTVLHYMAAGDNETAYLGTKVYATGRHGAHFAVLLFDAETAAWLATIEADALGQIRTGAASGVATRHMAPPAASVLGMIGAGHQAETQLEAVAKVRTLKQAKVFCRSGERRTKFAKKMADRLGLAVVPVDSAQKAIRESEIVVTITNSRDPVFEAAWLEPGCHLNAAGSNHAKRHELDGAAVEQAAVIAADSVEQAKLECGDLLQAAEEGRLDWVTVQELAAIVKGRIPGRNSSAEVTLFESQGLAIEDIAVAGYVYERLRGKRG